MKYYETLEPVMRERLFAVMRELDDEQLAAVQRHRALQPPYGTIGWGSADFDELLKSEVLGSFLRALRHGSDPAGARTQAAAEGRVVVELWNKRGSRSRVSIGGSYALARWEQAGDSIADAAYYRVCARMVP